MENFAKIRIMTDVSKKNNTFFIRGFSEINEDGNEFPSIYQSEVLIEEKIIDGVEGIEGELLMSMDENSDAKIINESSLNISADEDDVKKYDKENENLIYNE